MDGDLQIGHWYTMDIQTATALQPSWLYLTWWSTLICHVFLILKPGRFSKVGHCLQAFYCLIQIVFYFFLLVFLFLSHSLLFWLIFSAVFANISSKKPWWSLKITMTFHDFPTFSSSRGLSCGGAVLSATSAKVDFQAVKLVKRTLKVKHSAELFQTLAESGPRW